MFRFPHVLRPTVPKTLQVPDRLLGPVNPSPFLFFPPRGVCWDEGMVSTDPGRNVSPGLTPNRIKTLMFYTLNRFIL